MCELRTGIFSSHSPVDGAPGIDYQSGDNESIMKVNGPDVFSLAIKTYKRQNLQLSCRHNTEDEFHPMDLPYPSQVLVCTEPYTELKLTWDGEKT